MPGSNTFAGVFLLLWLLHGHQAPELLMKTVRWSWATVAPMGLMDALAQILMSNCSSCLVSGC